MRSGDIEDISKQSFLLPYSIYQQKSIYNPEALVLATVRNRCIIYWRRRRSQICESVDREILDLLAQPEAPRQNGTILRHELERVLGQLPERWRSLLRLRYGLGYKPAEVAEALGYQPSSIRKVTSRCLARLTQQLTALGFRDGDDEDDEDGARRRPSSRPLPTGIFSRLGTFLTLMESPFFVLR